MYEILNNLLADRKSDTVFSCFGVWHLLYLAAIFGIITFLLIFLKNKSEKAKKQAINTSVNLAFGLYIADFFLMPFACGEIDLEKLPFHICTAMCVMCFLSRHTRFFGKFKTEFAVLGLISNFVYAVYPAGIGWYQIHPFSYRVFQTLLFHGVMTAYGIFTVAFEGVEKAFRKCYKDLGVITAMTLWAMLGNALYNGTVGDYSHFFNWFFVLRDPFYMLPENVAPYIMPPLNIGLFFAVTMLVYLMYFAVKKPKRR